MCRTIERGRGRLAALLAAPLLALAAFAASAEPVRLAVRFSDGQMPVTLQAFKTLIEEEPRLRGEVDLVFVTESTITGLEPAEVLRSDVLVLDMMNQQLLDRFNEEHGVDLIAGVDEHGAVIAVGVGIAPKETYIEKGAIFDARAQAYWQHSGAANQLGLIKYALSVAGEAAMTLPEPEVSLDFGFYYPDGDRGRVFATWEAFDEWRTAISTREAIGRLNATETPVSRSSRFSRLPTTVGAIRPASSGTATWNVPSNIESPVADSRHSRSFRPYKVTRFTTGTSSFSSERAVSKSEKRNMKPSATSTRASPASSSKSSSNVTEPG